MAMGANHDEGRNAVGGRQCLATVGRCCDAINSTRRGLHQSQTLSPCLAGAIDADAVSRTAPTGFSDGLLPVAVNSIRYLSFAVNERNTNALLEPTIP